MLNYSSLHEKLPVHVRKVFKGRTQPSLTPETLKTSRGIALLFGAIFMAWMSVQITQNQATQEYRESHWPPESVWSETLAHRGLVLEKDPGAQSSILKSHPRAFSGDSTIWGTADGCIVYLSKSAYRPTPELWTCEKKPEVKKWGSFGQGLAGFEKLVNFFENTPIHAAKKAARAAYKVDPKEIHY